MKKEVPEDYIQYDTVSKPSKNKLLTFRDTHPGKSVKSMRMKHKMGLGYVKGSKKAQRMRGSSRM